VLQISQTSAQKKRNIAMERDQQVYGNKHAPQTGVLLVHGLNGSTHDMEELAQYLAAQGMVTENILLPGHGTNVRDMLPIGWTEWARAVRQEYQTLQERCDRVFVIGHSLGGALCLHLAAHEKVAGVITMCAPLHMFPWMIPAVRLVRYITPLLPTVREDVWDPIARRRHTRNVYRWTPLAPLDSLFLSLPQLRAELPKITAPALIMAAQHDHVVPVQDGIKIYEQLGSPDKQLLVLYHSYHVIMKDYDRDKVFHSTLAFIQRQIEQQGSTNIAEQSA
jgi:carboxylesterase